MKRITVADYTVAAYEKNCKFRKKTESAKLLDGAGIDIIELGMAKSEKSDAVVFKTIASVVKNATVALSCDSVEGAEYAWSCIKDAKKARLVVSLPVSTVQMEYFYHMKNTKMLPYLESVCKAACAVCEDVEFSALDAGRADVNFLQEMAKAAESCGVKTVTLCDDEGTLMPEDFANLVMAVKSVTGCEVFVKTSDALSMAASCAVFAIDAGADGVKCASVGGGLSPAVFSDIIRARGEDIGVCCNVDKCVIHNTVSQIKDTEAVGIEKDIAGGETIVLDKNSTVDSLTEATAALGYDLSAEDIKKVFEEFSRVAEKKEYVSESELEAIVAAAAMQVPSTYHLVSYTISCSNVTSAMAHIILERDGEQISGTGTGDGPIDAAFSAIEMAVGHHYELDDFQIHAVTKGHGAVGSTVVKLRRDGSLFPGVGVSTDIVGASIRAYINALNKIVYEA